MPISTRVKLKNTLPIQIIKRGVIVYDHQLFSFFSIFSFYIFQAEIWAFY